MTKPMYQTYKLPDIGKWMRVEIVGETTEDMKIGRDNYLRTYKMHDARVEYQTSQSCVIRRYYRM
tara:strand:- start:3784 stop:3978 length:195 start_codon:yes stop_codon:yes gene_type:complete